MVAIHATPLPFQSQQQDPDHATSGSLIALSIIVSLAAIGIIIFVVLKLRHQTSSEPWQSYRLDETSLTSSASHTQSSNLNVPGIGVIGRKQTASSFIQEGNYGENPVSREYGPFRIKSNPYWLDWGIDGVILLHDATPWQRFLWTILSRKPVEEPDFHPVNKLLQKIFEAKRTE
jgi:hypothetical protein